MVTGLYSHINAFSSLGGQATNLAATNEPQSCPTYTKPDRIVPNHMSHDLASREDW